MKSKEDLLIEYFGMGHLIRVLPRITILELIGKDCFIRDRQGVEVDSVRRCLKAVRDSTHWRRTEEYENLIEFSPEAWAALHDFGGS